MIHPAYAAENDRSRERLSHLMTRLREEDLKRTVESGWTVATVLLHLAFWDRYCLALLEGWERSGYVPSAANVEALNDTIEFLSLSFPPQRAGELARSAADLIDHKLEQISSDLAQTLEESGRARILRRALHRNEHLDQIERVLTLS